MPKFRTQTALAMRGRLQGTQSAPNSPFQRHYDEARAKGLDMEEAICWASSKCYHSLDSNTFDCAQYEQYNHGHPCPCERWLKGPVK